MASFNPSLTYFKIAGPNEKGLCQWVANACQHGHELLSREISYDLLISSTPKTVCIQDKSPKI
jgi:hypothetical protein